MARLDPCRPVPADRVTQWQAEADVVVVGLGAAGCSAALEAAHAGAEVLALELGGGAGGTTALAGGLIYLGGGTPVQQACGIEDHPEDMYRYVLASAGPNADEEKVRRYCAGSLEQYARLGATGGECDTGYYQAQDTHTAGEGALV